MSGSTTLRGIVQEIEGDYVVSLPSSVVDRLDLQEGQELEVFLVNNSIMARPIQ